MPERGEGGDRGERGRPEGPGGPREQEGQGEQGGPDRARTDIIDWVDAAGSDGAVFLQVLARRDTDRYELRHVADRGRPLAELAITSDPHAAASIARTTDGGGHRPLKTAPDLRRGWAIVGLGPGELWEAMTHLYPGAPIAWHRLRAGTLRPVSFRATADRQTGMYDSIRDLPRQTVDATVRACCDHVFCLRRVAWSVEPDDPETPLEPAGTTATDPRTARVPCPEPCPLFLSFALEAQRIEAVPGDRTQVELSGTESEHLLTALRLALERANAGELDVRTADFSHPLNPRRVRFLIDKLAALESDGPKT